MKSEYKINFSELSIIENQIDYNFQEGGYDQMTNNKIIDLWQNPDYNETYINFYSLVNKYLRGIEFEVKSEWLVAMKLQSKKDFYDFIIYYINKLTNIIYKNVSLEKKIFYRGENRKNFNYKVGDVLFYSTFQSVSTSISTAYKFSESVSNTKLLFAIEIPSGFYYKQLHTRLKIYNYKDKITKIIDEKEYIIMPNSYYVILEINKIYNNVNLIKTRLCEQKYYQIINSELYKQEDITIKNKNYKNFNSKELNNFIIKSLKYQKMINTLNSMKDYQINRDFYLEMENENFSNMFNIDIDSINLTINKINDFNIKETYEQIKKLGIGYYDYELNSIDKYRKKIDRINILINTDFKKIDRLTVYAGLKNIDETFKKPEFIELIKSKKIGEEFVYDKIIKSNLEIDKFLYNDIYNNDYPHTKIKKNNSTKLIYYKYIFQFNLTNVKISLCTTHPFEYYNNIILIPNYKMKIIKKIKKDNKYKLSYILYIIDIFGN
jgi:hypothetical protein